MTDADIIQRAKDVMPGGVSSPVRALKAVDADPLFVTKGEGAYVWDTNNKQHLDLCMSFGPLIFGHAHPQIVQAVQDTALNGTSFGISTEREVELAEHIIKSHPATEWVRFVNSGTEAVMSVIRLARGITDRDLIIKFNGCYHGHVDSMLVKSGSGLATFGISSSKGVPGDVSKNTIVLNLGDIEEVKAAFEKYPNQIAAVIIEGIPANNGLLIQSREYMQALQQVTKENGALFILDEVITGFRIGLSGATGHYNLDPDLVVMGKVIGGGLPVGLYGGKKVYMNFVAPLGNVYQAGTLSGNPLAMAAGLATIKLIESQDVYTKLEQIGNKVEQELVQVFKQANTPLTLRRVGSIFWLILEDNLQPITPQEVTDEVVAKYKRFHKQAMKEGVYLPPSAFEVAFLSTSHGSEIDTLTDRIRRALQ